LILLRYDCGALNTTLWGQRLVAAACSAALLGVAARAQSYRDQLYTIYASSAAPQHYKRAAAKALRLPTPVRPTAFFSRPSVKTIALSSPHGAIPLQLACGALSVLCRPMTLRGVPAGSTVSVYARGGALVKTLGLDATGAAAWDGTNQTGAVAPGGAYTVVVQGAGGSATFGVTVQ
jgi:hypothetical protein